jgi:hypothetical protein
MMGIVHVVIPRTFGMMQQCGDVMTVVGWGVIVDECIYTRKCYEKYRR